MAIWVIKDGQREGPYEEEDVRELIYEGTYTERDPAIRDGQYDWSTISEVIGPVSAELSPIAESEPDLDLLDQEEEQETPVAPEEIPEPEPVQLPPPPRGPPPPMRVTVSDIDIPFGSMVIFLLKWAGALLVVLLIAGAVMGVVWAILAALVAMILR